MENDNSGIDSGRASLLRGDATVSRRTLLTASAKIGAALGGAALLTACGGNLNSSISPATQKRGLAALAGGTPVRGGTFTVGVLSGGQEENLFPGTAVTTPDYVRNYNLYNLLFYLGENISPLVPGLALSAESNASATVWTFKLRAGVEWHDGKPFSADDVVYNFTSVWSKPSLDYSSGFLA